jgi:hypothetical protein
MSKLKSYTNFINETLTIDVEQLSFLESKQIAIIQWFKDGKIGNCTFCDSEITKIGRNLERFLIIRFNDNNFLYKIFLSVSQYDCYLSDKEKSEEVKAENPIEVNDKFSKMGVSGKKFVMDFDQDLTPLGGDIISPPNTQVEITPSEFNPDYIDDMIEKLELYKEDDETEQLQQVQQKTGEQQDLQQGEVEIQGDQQQAQGGGQQQAMIQPKTQEGEDTQ